MVVNNEFICDDKWNEKVAQVICRQLGFGLKTKAIPTRGCAFKTKMRSRSITTNDVVCTGNEGKLNDCWASRRQCDSKREAGVACVDLKKLQLVGGKGPEGNLFIDNLPVCDKDWGEDGAQIACNQLFRNQFPDRENVPVFRATNKSNFGKSKMSFCMMDSIKCNGSEKHLSDCKFVTRAAGTQAQLAGVQCAKCNTANLTAIVDSVTVFDTAAETAVSIDAALKRLKTQCYPWDCAIFRPVYPEYCAVFSFLQDSYYILAKSSRRQAQVSLTWGNYCNIIL